MIEAVVAVTFAIMGSEGTIINWNHALGSYKPDRTTHSRSKHVQTPAGSSGKHFSTQREVFTVPRRQNTSSESYVYTLYIQSGRFSALESRFFFGIEI